MKKNFLTIILILVVIFICILGLTACSGNKASFKLNFVVDDMVYATIDTSGNEVIDLPEAPSKENHTFDGWYWDKDSWQTPFTSSSLLDMSLSSDMFVYAKFSLNTIAGVSFECVETIYDGTEKTIAVSNLPNGASVLYDKANTYINAGEYTVTATVSQDNHEDLQLTATLTINKASYDMSAVVFEDKNVTYSGNAYSIEAQNVPSGLSVSYTGNHRTNVDTYTVTAIFTDTTGNYNNPKNMTAKLVINKAVITGITFTDKTFTYDTKTHSLAIEGTLPTCVNVRYTNNDKVNANTYTVTASFKDTSGNYTVPEDMTAVLTIEKAVCDMSNVTFENKTVTYDGKVHSLAISGTIPNEVTVSYVNNGKTNASTYNVTATFSCETGNYTVPENISAQLIIKKAIVTGISFEDKTFTYNGEKRSIEISGTLPNEVTVSYVNNGKINASTYSVTATFSCETGNYIVPEDMTAVLTIKKAVYDMSNVTFENKSVTYDGQSHSLAISGTLPNGVTVSYTNNDKINANQYIVIAVFTGDFLNYYAIDDMQALLTINKATYDMSGVSFVGGRFTYDGTQKFIYVTGSLPYGVTVNYNNNGKVDVNTYTVTATFTGDTENYNKIHDWTASLIIDKATYDMSDVSFANKTFTYDTTAKSVLITGTIPNGVEVSYVGNGKTDVGFYTVTAKFNGDSNNYHLIDDMTATLKINQATPYIKEVSCKQSLNIYSTVELVADTEVLGKVSFDQGQALTLGDNTYSWTFIPEDTHNYTSVTGTVGLTVCAVVSYYNDGVLIGSQNVVLNNSATVPATTPLREDSNGQSYTFAHWSIEENGLEYTFTTAITSNLNLYAVYDSDEIVYAINYHNTKDVEHDNITTYTVSTESALLSLEKEHYIFNGWKDKNGNEVVLIHKGTFGTLDLYATWTLVEYTITYDLGYRGVENGSNPKTYNVEDSFLLAPATYDEYHTFVGWYLEESFVNGKANISAGESGAITLYAKWNFSGTYVSTVVELQSMAYNMAGVYELKNDIYLTNATWTAIGDSTNPFTGYFNGSDFSVKGKQLFGEVSKTGKIVNVCVDNYVVTRNYGYVYNVHSTSSTLVEENYGEVNYCSGGNGLINVNYGGTVRYSWSTNGAAVQDSVYGGLIAISMGGTIEQCYSQGNVQIDMPIGSTLTIGGFIGRIRLRDEGNSCTINVSNCYSSVNFVIATSSRSSYIFGGFICEIKYYGDTGGSTYIKNCAAWGNFTTDDTSSDITAGFIYSPVVSNSTTKIDNCFSVFSSFAPNYDFDYVWGNGKYIKSNCYYWAYPDRGNTSLYNLKSRNFIIDKLKWEETIWHLQDGEFPKLAFELEKKREIYDL